MRITRVFLLLWSCAASPAMSSAYGVEEVLEVSPSEVYLPKSLARCQAALMRENDFMTYLNGLKAFLESSTCEIDQSDEIIDYIKKQLQRCPYAREIFLDGISQTISCVEGNSSAFLVNIEDITNIGSWDEFQSLADEYVTKYNSMLTSRIPKRNTLEKFPHTQPSEMAKHDPLNRLLAQVAIDQHSLRSMCVKESYQKMCVYDPVLARAYLKKIGPQTTLGRYVQKELKEIPDPDTCLIQDGKMFTFTAEALLTSFCRQGTLSVRGKTRLRLQKKLAQKKAQGSEVPAKAVSPKKRISTSARSVMSESAAAAIKSDVETKRQEAATREEAKRQRALADQQRAQEMQASLREVRAAQGLLPASERFQDASSVSSSSAWTAPVMRVREKTRGVADPAYAPASSSSSSSSSASSSHTEARTAPLTSGVMRRLEAFWESKAGFTYQEIASLFTSLGGRISEKSGGSSHVTFSYIKGDGTKLKHELWRPHGKGNTFGFRTLAGLRSYFERCGLTLKD